MPCADHSGAVASRHAPPDPDANATHPADKPMALIAD